MKIKRTSILSTILTLAVILFLIIIGPTSAIAMSIKSHDITVKEHEIATFETQLNINTAQRVKINYITITIKDQNNNQKDICTLTSKGKEIKCDKSFLNIKPLINNNNQKGYGYGYEDQGQELKYRIKWRAPYTQQDKEFTISMTANTDKGNYELENPITILVTDDNKKKNFPFNSENTCHQ